MIERALAAEAMSCSSPTATSCASSPPAGSSCRRSAAALRARHRRAVRARLRARDPRDPPLERDLNDARRRGCVREPSSQAGLRTCPSSAVERPARVTRQRRTLRGDEARSPAPALDRSAAGHGRARPRRHLPDQRLRRRRRLWAWVPFNSNDPAFDIQPGCPFTAITASSATAVAGFFEAGWWRLTAPPGTVVDRLRIARYGYRFIDQPDNPVGGVNQGGWISEAYTEDGPIAAGFAREGCQIAVGQYLCDWGSKDPAAAVDRDLDAEQVTYQVACIRGTGCRSGSDAAFPLAAVTIHNAVATIRDDTAPALQRRRAAAGRRLAAPGRRARRRRPRTSPASAPLTATAGAATGTLATPCRFTRPVPCGNVSDGSAAARRARRWRAHALRHRQGRGRQPDNVDARRQRRRHAALGRPAAAARSHARGRGRRRGLRRGRRPDLRRRHAAPDHARRRPPDGAPAEREPYPRRHPRVRHRRRRQHRDRRAAADHDPRPHPRAQRARRSCCAAGSRPRPGRRWPNVALQATATIRRRGAAAQPAGAATTDARGRFALRLPAGPSRTVRLIVPAAGEILRAARGVSVRVPASSTIHASRRVVGPGARVTFSGTIRRAGQSLPAPRPRRRPAGPFAAVRGSASPTPAPRARAAGARATASAACPAATRCGCGSAARTASRSSSATRRRRRSGFAEPLGSRG